ncbi:hypothetical protein HMI56_007593 [Coelomomyces lativittatus]|nr:hypothetical protein HMI56_007593 [Coelomomyces lativittatus]
MMNQGHSFFGSVAMLVSMILLTNWNTLVFSAALPHALPLTLDTISSTSTFVW